MIIKKFSFDEGYEEKTFYIENTNWDDFGYTTTYLLSYYSNSKLNIIGEVKILEEEKYSTCLKDNFEKSNKTYCSLGQSKSYYEKIKKILEKKEAENLLIALKDCCFNEKIYSEFKEETGFINSLLRNPTAVALVTGLGGELLDGIKENKENNFYKYIHKIEGATEPHEINFNFKKSELPYRMNAIIGKNGVGKTEILKSLLSDLIKENTVSFENYPKYEKVFFFYYGRYDALTLLKELSKEKSKNFELLGLDFDEDKITKLIEKIEKDGKKEYLRSMLLNLMEYPEVVDQFLNNPQIGITKYSSGQKMITKFTIEIISKIKKESLIVIDEPENHLHPNLIGRLMKHLGKILNDYSSHAIISTHSPLILQQITSDHVILLKRSEDRPIVAKLDIECFGEDLSVITNSIFNVNEVDDNYKEVLLNLKKKGLTYDKILSLFNEKLNYNCKLYLKQIMHLDN